MLLGDNAFRSEGQVVVEDQSRGQQGAPRGGGGNGGGALHPANFTPGGQQFNGFDIAGLSLGSDGHIYGERRVISGDPNSPGNSRYGYETIDLGDANNLGAVSNASSIPQGALSQRVAELRIQNAQTQARGYGTLQSANPDGSYTYLDGHTGQQVTTTDVGQLNSVGITNGQVAQERARAAESQRTLTQMGQYTIAGQNPDGSIQVRDFNGRLSNVTAQQAAQGQIPGVSYAEYQRAVSEFGQNQRNITQMGQYTVAGFNADGSATVRDFNGALHVITAQQVAEGRVPGISQAEWLRAKAEYTTNTRTQTEAGQYTALNYNPDGTVAVRDGYGKITNVPEAQAASLPGVSQGQLQYLQQQGNERNFLGSAVPNYGAQLGVGAYNQYPTQGPTPPGGVTQTTAYGADGPIAPPGGQNAMQGGYQQYGAPAPAGPSPSVLPQTTPFNGVAQISPTPSGGMTQFAGAQQFVTPPGGPLPGATPMARDSGAPTGTTPAQAPAIPSPSTTTTPAAPQGSATGTAPASQGTAPARTVLPQTNGPNATASPAQQASYATYGTAATAPGGNGVGTNPSPAYSGASFHGTQQGLQFANQGMQNYFQYGQNRFNIAHQGQTQANDAYKYNQTQTEAQNAGQSRDLSGMGFSGITRPVIAGTN